MGGFVFEKGFRFGAQILMARLLGASGFGSVTIGLTVVETIGLLILLGLNKGIGRHLPRTEDAAYRRGVLVSTLQIVVPLAIAASLILVFTSEMVATMVFKDPSLAPIIRVCAYAIPAISLIKITIGTIQGLEQSFPKVYIQNIIGPISRFGLVAGALYLGFDSLGVSWAITASYAITGLVALSYLVWRTPLISGPSPMSMHGDLLRFSLPLVVTAATILILSNIDVFMLGYFTSANDVGLYRSVYPLAQLMVMVFAAFRFIVMPILSDLDSTEDISEMREIYRMATKWIFIMTLPLYTLTLLYPTALVGVIYGVEYLPGAVVLPILATGFMIHGSAGPNEGSLLSIGRTKQIMYSNIIATILNIVLNVLLIQRYGIEGAAVATAISYAAMNLLYNGFLYRYRRITPLDGDFLRLVAVATVCVVVLAILNSWLPSILLRVSVLLPLAILLYIGFVLGLAVGPREVKLIEMHLSEKGVKNEMLVTILHRLY